MSRKKKNQENKKGLSRSRFYLVRLFMRFFITCYFVGIYLTNRSLLDVSGFPKWTGLYVICGIMLVDIISRFFPLSIHPIGRKKYLKREFVPTQAWKNDPNLTQEDYKKLREMNGQLLRGCLFYFILTAIFFVLYFIGIFGVPELFLVMLAYWVGEMICSNLFCPFRSIFMHNRCCTVCRIYNWDAIFLVFPLAVVPGILTWGLLLVAIAYTFVWELNFRLHPERFLERTNKAIQCEHCSKDMCPVKRRALLKSFFSKE